MERRRYLVSYDVADDRRRTQVFTILTGAGDHVQYSVFFCDLNEREFVELRGRLRRVIHQREDQVLFADLGHAAHSLEAVIETIGKGYAPSVRAVVI